MQRPCRVVRDEVQDGYGRGGLLCGLITSTSVAPAPVVWLSLDVRLDVRLWLGRCATRQLPTFLLQQRVRPASRPCENRRKACPLALGGPLDAGSRRAIPLHAAHRYVPGGYFSASCLCNFLLERPGKCTASNYMVPHSERGLPESECVRGRLVTGPGHLDSARRALVRPCKMQQSST
jgi:hypothetical protein